MATKRRVELIRLPAAFAAQIPPLGGADLALAQRALGDVAPDWTVELAGTCSEEATLVVVPDDGDDAAGPSFVISRESYGLRLDQLHWDDATEVGVFASLTEVLEVLVSRLAFCIDVIVPSAVTLH